MKVKIRWAIFFFFALVFCWSSVSRFAGSAQERNPGTSSPVATPTPQSDFGNVQVLKGVRDLLPTMHFIRASLGVRCDYCHVTETNKYHLDDKPAKRRAREMIVMTRQLNESAFHGKQVITCNTCHRGSPKPVGVPEIATDFVNTTKVEPFEPPPPTYPSANQILSKYETVTRAGALGPARLSVESFRAKLISGNTGTGRVLPRAERALSDALVDGEKGVTTSRLSNGQTARVGSTGDRVWSLSAEGPRWAPPGFNISQFQRRINPLLVLRVRTSDFASVTVSGVEKIDGAEAYVVKAARTDGTSETLWFSKRYGWLVRRTYFHPTLLGLEPEQYDLSEYKRFGSFLLPTVINASYLDDQHLGVLKRLLQVKLGVVVTDKDFEPHI